MADKLTSNPSPNCISANQNLLDHVQLSSTLICAVSATYAADIYEIMYIVKMGRRHADINGPLPLKHQKLRPHRPPKFKSIEKDAPMPYYHLINLLMSFFSI